MCVTDEIKMAHEVQKRWLAKKHRRINVYHIEFKLKSDLIFKKENYFRPSQCWHIFYFVGAASERMTAQFTDRSVAGRRLVNCAALLGFERTLLFFRLFYETIIGSSCFIFYSFHVNVRHSNEFRTCTALFRLAYALLRLFCTVGAARTVYYFLTTLFCKRKKSKKRTRPDGVL